VTVITALLETLGKIEHMKKMIVSMTLIVVLVGVFAIFSSQQTTPRSNSQASLPNVDSSSHSLDEFLERNNATPEIVEAYRFAKENPRGVLSTVKCYCGCLINGSQHKNNWHCFFNDDGSIDLMGLNCGLCIKTALLSKQVLAEGKTVQEISDYVDSRWGKEI